MTVHSYTYHLFTIAGSNQDPIVVGVTVNNSPVQMELDTGIIVTIEQSYLWEDPWPAVATNRCSAEDI